jgi:hypothetical protein
MTRPLGHPTEGRGELNFCDIHNGVAPSKRELKVRRAKLAFNLTKAEPQELQIDRRFRMGFCHLARLAKRMDCEFLKASG